MVSTTSIVSPSAPSVPAFPSCAEWCYPRTDPPPPVSAPPQLRGAQLLDALRLHKQGYPEHLPFSEFRRRFALLAPDLPAEGDQREAADQLLLQLDVDPAAYRLGLSQVSQSHRLRHG